jgi:hypothetical protein
MLIRERKDSAGAEKSMHAPQPLASCEAWVRSAMRVVGDDVAKTAPQKFPGGGLRGQEGW